MLMTNICILENSALEFSKLYGLKLQEQFWTVDSWLETFISGGSDFSTEVLPPPIKCFHNHPDCLRISFATLNVSEIENNSLSSVTFFSAQNSHFWQKDVVECKARCWSSCNISWLFGPQKRRELGKRREGSPLVVAKKLGRVFRR